MPKLRTSRGGHFTYSSLSLRDALWLQGDLPPSFPVDASRDAGGPSRLHSMADFECAYRQNRPELLRLKSWRNPAGHLAGERCWGFWVFDRGMARPPKHQILELHRLRMIGRAERRELLQNLDLYPNRYAGAGKQLIESWRAKDGPPSSPAKVSRFVEDPDDDEE